MTPTGRYITFHKIKRVQRQVRTLFLRKETVPAETGIAEIFGKILERIIGCD